MTLWLDKKVSRSVWLVSSFLCLGQTGAWTEPETTYVFCLARLESNGSVLFVAWPGTASSQQYACANTLLVFSGCCRTLQASPRRLFFNAWARLITSHTYLARLNIQWELPGQASSGIFWTSTKHFPGNIQAHARPGNNLSGSYPNSPVYF